jgi:hypothetical protein
VPAPGFRYGYTRPSTSFGTGQIFICDLQSNLFTRVTIDGDPEGWWNDHTILFKDSLHNLKLFDVATHATSTLLTAEAISASLQELGLSPKAAALAVLCHWNGRDYDVLLTEDKEKNWGDSFLVRAERGESKVVLKLISRAFKFQWGGHFNAERTLYLYEGENGPPGRGGNGAVFIRDMADGSSRTVVPPDNGGQYSLPRFGGEGVIYWRKRLLWQVDLNGSNNVPLLTQPSQ